MITYHGPCNNCDTGVYCTESLTTTLGFVSGSGGVNYICAYCSNRSGYTIRCRACLSMPLRPPAGTLFINYTSESRTATPQVILYNSQEDVRVVFTPNLANPYGWREQGMRAPYGQSIGGSAYHELLVDWSDERPVAFYDVNNQNYPVGLRNWPPPPQQPPAAQPAVARPGRVVNQVYGYMNPGAAPGVVRGEAPDDCQVFERMADGRIPCRCNRCR